MPTWWEHLTHVATGRSRRHVDLPDLRHLPSRRVSLERTHYVVNDPERHHRGQRLYVLRHEADRRSRRPARVAVFSNGRDVGYLPSRVAATLAPHLDTLGGAAVVNGAGPATDSIRLRVDLPTAAALAVYTETRAAIEEERMTRITWQGIESPSTETCEIEFSERGMVANGVVDTDGGRLTYRVETDATGAFRLADLAIGGRALGLSFSDGRWLVNGEHRGDLDGATEIDISATPLTNTLPIRRLNLSIGESADIDTAWIAVPDLTVVRDAQRYTRVGERQWLYESRDSDFRATLMVDDDGVVLDYPGLFRAVL
ncbi:putative glycolipid-binding domain-containing protein [Microbacterium invictum]|uniref:Glycolipid-binding domain-containing protein n=1 Tax=Microbacterium invictum TaxID=515415 RepID=A0ABZ0V9X4_9MICO|nr:putative glycolipid-binding domain-containing protein [Microbacterium invictum]WQB69678.1 putative glycolipid-binding domain-containing protein [Microbacterium invictum]